MKKAFTMIELVFVIMVIGILSAVIIPRIQTNPLQEAATQLVSDIRYTQHLAMSDDKYSVNNPVWYKERWQMKFSKVGGSDHQWAYAIFSDKDNGHGYDGNPNANETAINPLDHAKKLTGGYSGTIEYDDPDASNKLNLGNSYGVKDIDMLGGCAISVDGRKRVYFDFLGRLMYENPKNLDTLFKDGNVNRLVASTCRIELCSVADCVSASESEKVTILIEPETGYAHIKGN